MSKYRFQVLLITIGTYVALSLFAGLALKEALGLPVESGFIAVLVAYATVREIQKSKR